MKGVFFASVTALAISASMAQAADPAVVYDQAGKFDKSFNEGVYNGVKNTRQTAAFRFESLNLKMKPK